MKYSATAKIKSIGRFDVNDGRSAVDWLNEIDMDDASLRDRVKEFFNAKDSAVREELYGLLPKMMDAVMWTRIWKATKLETRQETGLAGEERLMATAERFDDIN